MGSPTKSIVLAIAPKFTALLSIFGSTAIILSVVRSPRRRGAIMHRIMLGMATTNILSSIWYFAGTWVIPAGTLSVYGDEISQTIFWAAGDQQGVACNFGGYFNQFAVANPLYNATLAWYYLLTVYYSWDDRRLQRIEWLLHTIPWGYALITATFAVATNLYGEVEWTCWILPTELFDESSTLSPVQSYFQMIQWIFLFGVVWVCVVFVTVIFAMLYHQMRRLEMKMEQYSIQLPSPHGSNSIRRPPAATIPEEENHDESDGKRLSPSQVAEVSSTDVAAIVDSTPDDTCKQTPDVEAGSERKSTSTLELTVSSCQLVLDEHSSPEGNNTGRNDNDANQSDDSDEEAESYPNVADRVDDDFIENKVTCSNTDTIGDAGGPAMEKQKKRPWGTMANRVTWLNSATSTIPSAGGGARGGITSSSSKRTQYQDYSKSRKIARQGMLYVIAFWITWLFPTINRITELTAGTKYFVVQFFDTFLLPLQGFLNFWIYIRNRLNRYRKSNPDVAFWRALKNVILEIN